MGEHRLRMAPGTVSKITGGKNRLTDGSVSKAKEGLERMGDGSLRKILFTTPITVTIQDWGHLAGNVTVDGTIYEEDTVVQTTTGKLLNVFLKGRPGKGAYIYDNGKEVAIGSANNPAKYKMTLTADTTVRLEKISNNKGYKAYITY